MGRPERVALPLVRALCPLSDATIGSKKIEPHYCNASLCANGSVHVWCVLHMFKGFISHPQLLEAWNVTEARKAKPAVRSGT